MTKDGFLVSGFDGSEPRGGGWSSLPAPFAFKGVKADAWGQTFIGDRIAFGEAKTDADVDTDHTRLQLTVLGQVRMKGSGALCPLYVAIPRSAVYDLDRVLIDVGLLRAKNIVRLHIPDALIEDSSNGPRQSFCSSA